MIRIATIALGAAIAGALPGAARATEADAATSAVAMALDYQAAAHEVVVLSVRRSVAALGQTDGFYLDPAYHIGLPRSLDGAVAVLDKAHATILSDALERSLNRAAENTADAAGAYLMQAAARITFANPDRLIEGPDNAVTAALREQLGPGLHAAMAPLIDANLNKAGTLAALEKVREKYEETTDRPFPAFNTQAYALDMFVANFFARVEAEEKNIRSRPSARNSEALREVFGPR